MTSRFEHVKQYIVDGIQNKVWGIDDRLPSENELVQACSVSRMTARRALKVLESEGLVYSIQGKGTFIAEAKHQSSAVELRNIADEVIARNQQYHCKVLSHEVREVIDIKQHFQDSNDALLFSSVIHYENDLPIQLEKRYVSPEIVPGYLDIDLHTITANEYLMEQCPAHKVSNQIEAVTATEELKKHLELADDEPCLKVTRMTWYQGKLVSYATLYHPGTRYALGTQFTIGDAQ